jgi:hypothetical protein
LAFKELQEIKVQREKKETLGNKDSKAKRESLGIQVE